MNLFARYRQPKFVRALRQQGVAGKMYAVSIASIALFAALMIYVASFAAQTRANIELVEQQGLRGATLVAELERLQQNQHGLILSFFLTPNHTFSKADFERLSQITNSLQALDAQAPGGSIIDSEEFATLRMLAADLLDEDGKFDRQDKLATLRVFLKVSTSVDRQLHAVVAARSASVHEAMQTIAAMGDTLAWRVGAAAVLLLVVIVPLMVLNVTRFVRRINGITRTMHRIADCETGIDVPSTVDVDEIGELARAVQAFKRNTIALQRNSDQMLKLNGWFDLALSNMQGGLSIFDQNQELVMCNERYLDLYGLPKEFGRPGTPLKTILQHWKDFAWTGAAEDPDATFDVDRALEDYAETVNGKQEFVRANHLPDGRTILVSCRPSLDGGWVDVHEDVTDRVQSDKTIERLAHSDLLTGLSNRHHFLKTLGEALDQPWHDASLAVLLIDMRNFKRINDTLGHESGDHVLKAVAARLAQLIGEGDSLARVGGDGFAIIKAGADRAAAAEFAQDFCFAVGSALDVDGQQVDIAINVGVAVAPSDGQTASDLMQRAEIALSQAKAAGRNQFALFDAELEASLRERRDLETDLKSALELGQLELHYQPIMEYKSRRVASMEALMRWKHPTRGMVPPGIFIPIAEEIGIIGELGRWAIGRACHDALNWPQHVKVAVNLSAEQFKTDDLHIVTHAALRDSGLPPKRLELEVTETLLLSDEQRTRRTLKRLKIMGVSVALDDFGTGYASLSYLRSFPFDKIKIDQTFVRDLPRDGDCNAIVRAVVMLARMLGMRTVAEGIETVEHLNQVVAAGCDEIQGYHLSRPVPVDAVPGIIADCEERLSAAA